MNTLFKYTIFCGLCILLFFTGCRSQKNSVDLDVSHSSLQNVDLGSGIRGRIVKEARTWIGTPYAYGHNEKGDGTDCSGLVLSVYESVAGIKLPRNSAKQAEFCENIKSENVKPGDLVFFATGSDPKKINHVGIMLDKEDFVHASQSKGVVISKISTPYYLQRFMMYGRALPN